ncbi:MAG: hypothetical protein E7265_00245 [Lachnospiraceae bacterium]|nr:hypothetical protein [Lachnospiraceae bacterium]
MSNLIKSVYFSVDNEKKKVIDSNETIGSMPVFRQETPEDFEFVPGINVLNIDEIIEQQREEMQANADTVLIEARNEAESILQNARLEAESIAEMARKNGYEQGYNDGMAASAEEVSGIKKEYEDMCIELQNTYNSMLEEAEPQMVELVCDVINRITGIVVNGCSDAILYIIDRNLKDLPMSDTYTVHVCPDDIGDVLLAKDSLAAAVRQGAVFDIIEDSTLTANQCIIETDTHVIDCSLDVQLDNLMKELRLISEVR